jgi:hypothetical protein
MKVPEFCATAIGSLPHTAAADAMKVILQSIPECPIWPQLPRRGLFEQMEIQYSEGLPRIVIDEQKGRMFFDTADEDASSAEIAAFYENYMAAEESGDWSSFSISEKYSAGIPAFSDALGKRPKAPWVKVQTTGPLSFGLSIVDEQKRAIFYNEMFRDVIVKSMAAKCRWQLDLFRPFAGQGMICFVDEPILSAFGSSTYVSLVRDDVVAILGEMANSIHAGGALCGVHCCGNTEWPILVDAGVDIINFDAFGFGETIALYPQQIRLHLEAGRYLAWGIVPTSEKAADLTVEDTIKLYEENVSRLAQKGIDKNLIYTQTILTPSCGTGSLKQDLAEKVFDLLGKTCRALRERNR